MASGVSTRKLRSGIWRPERERVRTATSELDGEIGILCKEVWDSRQTLDFRRHKAYGGHRTLGIVPGGWQHACAWLGTRKMRSQKNCMGMYGWIDKKFKKARKKVFFENFLRATFRASGEQEKN
ncbi:hypothetical protein HPP92_006021 [Vanilla planifolia]|uniref:Uncharacterized protein n=1 Tax=Vanilla planifolia TaxID=51239 RepID=A0A835VCT1_VANPL|nr:hypothetical protein HPP92_006021 [Vanilla planifolia]